METAPTIKGMKAEKVGTDAAEVGRCGGESLFSFYCFHFLLLLAPLFKSVVITSFPSLKLYFEPK